MPEIELDKNYFVRVINENSSITGIFRICNEGIKATLYDYSEFFTFNKESHLFLQLENQIFVTLFNFYGNHSRNSSVINKSTIFSETIFANLAISGSINWRPEDNIYRTSFRFDGCNSILENEAIYRLIAEKDLLDIDKLPNLIKISLDECTITFSYSVNAEIVYMLNKEIFPFIRIEFTESKGLDNYIHEIDDLSCFLSCVSGQAIYPRDIYISNIYESDIPEAIENNKYFGDFKVWYINSRQVKKIENTHPLTALSNCYNNSKLNNFKELCECWMKRGKSWKSANLLMRAALYLNGVISGERLLNACRWLEEIPIAQTLKTIKDEDVTLLIDAAVNKANEIGLSDKRARIENSLRNISNENRRDLFSRLTREIETVFGNDIFDQFDWNIVESLMTAYTYRGKIAHKLYNPIEDNQPYLFQRSIFAMESFCYLLTIKDLPLLDDVHDRLTSMSIVRNYRLAYDLNKLG